MPFIRVNTINLHYTDAGEGPPLVFLHGWGTSGRVWDQQAVHFAARYRVIQPDWRGCGYTEARADGNTIAQIASDIVEFLEALNLDRVTLVGTSMGATFAIEAARDQPQRLRRIVAVDAPFHLGTRSPDSAVLSLSEQLASNRIATLSRMVSSWYSGADSEAFGAWARAQVFASSPFIAALYADHREYDPRAYLRNIAVPITLIHGAEDPDVPVSIAHEIAELLGQEPPHVIEHAGHFPHHTEAVAFNAVLESILVSGEAT
ncbi:alpha/beta hydrolase [Mycetocola lacteus]|uniref:Alpha/beta hydrolase n=1 Tax=Mycetocola lacteus TaxID=76637 RepID=A0A3L7AZ78_9MICO|nr:alpha/beta hydrolase [Mycetocola lacteus]RLP80697.1 alpha/beta hydrolase [Mycetocola lacteus]RLP84482.1 alpha/beta hydrolase [Mycetocola lacteus]